MRRRAELGYLYHKRLKSYNHKYAYSSKLYSCMKNSLCSVWCGFHDKGAFDTNNIWARDWNLSTFR